MDANTLKKTLIFSKMLKTFTKLTLNKSLQNNLGGKLSKVTEKIDLQNY